MRQALSKKETTGPSSLHFYMIQQTPGSHGKGIPAFIRGVLYLLFRKYILSLFGEMEGKATDVPS